MDALGPRFTMPTFEVFYDHLTREQTKLTQLDSLTELKTQELVAQTSKEKSKKKPKHKTDSVGSESSSQPTPKSNAQKSTLKGKSSKFGESSSKTKRFTSDPCSFCGKEVLGIRCLNIG